MTNAVREQKVGTATPPCRGRPGRAEAPVLTGGATVPPILDPAPDWNRPGDPSDFQRFLVLWHGCTTWDLNAIRSKPSVRSTRAGRVDVDFGQGFYTTSIKRQARHWAWKRYHDIPTLAGARRASLSSRWC